jgi:hypothetical protein
MFDGSTCEQQIGAAQRAHILTDGRRNDGALFWTTPVRRTVRGLATLLP